MNRNYSEHEKAFYSDGYKLGITAIEKGMNRNKLLETIRKMYLTIDDLNKSLEGFATKQGINIDCKKGCDWCCYQPVFAISHEIDFLTDFIKNNFSKIEQEQIKTRAKQKDEKFIGLNETESQNIKHACPLLANGKCVAYNARPMACRIYLSMDVASCLQFYKFPDDKNNHPKLLEFPLIAGKMMNEGFKAALKTEGVLSTEFRIEEGILVALK